MKRARSSLLVLLTLGVTLVALWGCSEKETNPFDPNQDTRAPEVTNFVYSGGAASWSTDEPTLSVLEYGPVGGDFTHYTYESTKYFSTFHEVRLLGSDDGEDYQVRVRSVDRAGNTSTTAGPVVPATIEGDTFTGESMRLLMVDVGWGLSMALTTPDGSNVMIDAGHPDHLNDVLTTLSDYGVSVFDAAVVTHYHIDHYGGYSEEGGVLESFNVGVFLAPDTTTVYRQMTASLAGALDDQGVEVVYVRQGDDSSTSPALQWDATPGFRAQVLGSGLGGLVDIEDDSGIEGMNTNNDSVVLKFTFGGVSFITTGDGEHFAEYRMIDAFGREALRADLLQIGHHGSDDSSSELWLDNVSPRVALISNAMIEAALEKEEVLQGINAVDADYYVTDRIFPNTPRDADPTYGNIVAWTDGETIEVVLDEHPW